MVRPEGVEPSTFWSEVRRSIQLSYERIRYVLNFKMNKTTKFLVDEGNNNSRLDKYLAFKLKILTRSQIKKNILFKNVRVDGKVVSSPSKKIRTGNLIEILIGKNTDENIKAQEMNVNIGLCN